MFSKGRGLKSSLFPSAADDQWERYEMQPLFRWKGRQNISDTTGCWRWAGGPCGAETWAAPGSAGRRPAGTPCRRPLQETKQQNQWSFFKNPTFDSSNIYLFLNGKIKTNILQNYLKQKVFIKNVWLLLYFKNRFSRDITIIWRPKSHKTNAGAFLSKTCVFIFIIPKVETRKKKA